jgi:hypothetical protein
MKKALTRTIIVCVAVNLMTAGFVLAQNAAEEKTQEVIEKEMTLEKKAADLVQKKMEKEMMEMMEVWATPVITMPPVPPRVSIPGWQYSGIGSILVIPAAQMKVEDLAAITEDMTVMSRIFDKKLSQAQLITGGSWPELSFGLDQRSFGRSSGAIEAIYLDGYGALFLMKVNALLSPPPEALEEKETEEEDTDPLWTQTIQEMYAPEEADRLRRRTDRPEEKYDAEKVKELKETLIKTLKHAANIRTLKSDESVILSVTGKAGQSATRTTTRSYGLGGALSGRRRSSRRSYNMPLRPVGAETGFSSPTVLTIRAKKSDIDAFANGTLSFDQFSQKTLLLSYSYLGGNLGDRPSRSSGLGGLGLGTSSSRRRDR